ncbi:efflux transporter outer membrane subunit [Comamonas composti]|uniref:efflux transporter outer membrane subunit n=1 Tax=Comamonas composti TaxID=408558 RepID=UPI0004002B11|nr:efflux transporter outer membrane subunit [Comamonas composti]
MTPVFPSSVTHRFIASGMLAALLGGCASLAPPHETPALPIPANWAAAPQADGQGANAPGLVWRDYFTDPVLQRLITTALENNRDLRIAALRAEEARAAFQIQRSEQFPTIGIGGQGGRARVPGDLNVTRRSVVSGEYRAEVGLSSWELDLWGRVRNLRDSAMQTWLASESGHQAVQVALITQVANGYLGLRELDERVAIARDTLDSRQESFRIFSRREAVGASSKLQLTQIQTLLTQAQALLAQLELGRAQQLHALAQLVGADPGPLPAAAAFDDTLVLAELQPGLPSQLLTARPDIIAAEHQLQAARANIGAARAAFFPRIALTGRWGSASAELDGLFDSGSRAWAFMPTISLPIFDGGLRRANLELGEIRRDSAIAQYEKTVQTAFREVADGLSARRWMAEQIAVQRTAVEAQSERARLAQLRYDHGSAAYLEVLDAQRDLLAAKQQLVQARRALLSSQVGLYAALGGGTQPSSNP